MRERVGVVAMVMSSDYGVGWGQLDVLQVLKCVNLCGTFYPISHIHLHYFFDNVEVCVCLDLT